MNTSSQLTMDIDLLKRKAKDLKGFNSLAEQLRIHGYLLDEVKRQGKRGTWILLAHNFENHQVAIKRKPVELCGRGEWKHWPTLCHPNILDIKDMFLSGHELFFVTEWVSLQDVHTAMLLRRNDGTLGANREIAFRRITIGVLKALNYLHGRGFAHLDVSWDHVLIDGNGQVYLAGFPALRNIRDQTQHSLGYPTLRAPESMHHGSAMRTNLPKLDMWSLGAALLRALLDRNIAGKAFASKFDQVDCNLIYQQQMENIAALPFVLHKSHISVQAQQFLLRLLNYQPELRPTAADSLRDPWFMAELSGCDIEREEFSNLNDDDICFAQDMGTMRQAVECPVECPVECAPAATQFSTTTITKQCCPIQQYECSSGCPQKCSSGCPQNQCMQPSPPVAQASFNESNSMSTLMAEHKWQSPLKRTCNASTPIRQTQQSVICPQICSPCGNQQESLMVCQSVAPQPCPPPPMKKIQQPLQHRATTSMPCKPPGDPCPLPAPPCPKLCQPDQPCILPCQVPPDPCEEVCEQQVLVLSPSSCKCRSCYQQSRPVVTPCPQTPCSPCGSPPLMKKIQLPSEHRVTTVMPCNPPSPPCPLPAQSCSKVCRPKEQPCLLPCQVPQEPCEEVCEQQVVLPNPCGCASCCMKTRQCPPKVIKQPCQPQLAVLRTPPPQHRSTTCTQDKPKVDPCPLPVRPCLQAKQSCRQARRAPQKLCKHQVPMQNTCKKCRRF